MRHTARLHKRLHSAGQSLIELALVLPILLVLCFGAAELSHAILFNNILINLSREGANLASRTTQSPPFIIDVLSQTCAPLQMETQGMIFISRIKGVDAGEGGVIAVIQEQHRAVQGDQTMLSRLWSCPQWDVSGKCTLPVSIATRVVTLPFALGVGYEVQVVEAVYNYTPLTNIFLAVAPQLYSVTIL